jgi:hypothetical protein
MNSTVKNLLIFGSGVILGAFIGVSLAGMKDGLEEVYEEEELRAIDEEEPELAGQKLVPLQNRYRKITTRYNGGLEIDEPVRDTEYPYVISIEEFSEERDDFDKISLSFYDVDRVLTDENEDVITDIDSVIGTEALSRFGVVSENPDVVYVRNEQLSTDYEIICIHDSYAEAILGGEDRPR